MKILYHLVIITALIAYVAFGPKEYLWWGALGTLWARNMAAIFIIEES